MPITVNPEHISELSEAERARAQRQQYPGPAAAVPDSPVSRAPLQNADRAVIWMASLLLASLGLCLPVSANEASEIESIYSYVNKSGRTVYVNGLDRVPETSRKRAKAVDLSHISLNQQLAADLEQAVDDQLGSLLTSNYCVNARNEASRSWVATLWQRHALLVLLAAVLLLFLLVSPYLVRTIGAPRWGKLLMILAPLLGFIALMGSAAMKTSAALNDLKEAADSCQHEQFAQLPDTPAGQAKRLHLMEGLRQRVAGAHGQHLNELDRAVRQETR